MFSSATLVCLFAVALTQGQLDEDPECRPPHPPGKDDKCCTIPELIVGENMQAMMKQCFEESGMERRPPGPPGSGTPPTPEEIEAHRSAHECVDECFFKAAKFMNSDGEFDLEAMKTAAASVFTGDWAPLGSETIDKCFASAKSQVSASAKCTSGAHRAKKCILRNFIINCPPSAWNDSTDCAALKARLTKCSNAMPPFPHHKH
uniref:Odorant binding protein 3 n=1 Tax=Apolygus lucorum TaxID=248454 RepID=F5B512_APOLU|nr:odorant binding protein 3 [Apolygus lucorum]